MPIDFTSFELSLTQFEKSLDTTFVQMLSSNANFINLGRTIGGIGALLYLSNRVWGHMARNEPIDFYPLLRPVVIAILLGIWPSFCAGLHGLSRAVASSTDDVRLQDTQEIIALNNKRREAQAAKEANKTVPDQVKDAALSILDPTGLLSSSGSDLVQDLLREVITDIASLATMVARLGLYLISSLFLMMLCIAGPIAFGLAVFPGFEGGIIKWFGNYVSIALWVPVANIFGLALDQVQKAILNNSIGALQNGESTDVQDLGLILFMILSTIAYVMVPKAAEMLVSATGAGGTSQLASSAMAPVNVAAAAAGGGWGRAAQLLKR